MIIRTIWIAKIIVALAVFSTGCVVDEQELEYIDHVVGTGQEALSGNVVTVHYTGWLYEDGEITTEFDSSVGGDPFTFTLDVGQVIAGWDEGIQGMKVGGIRELIIPPNLAYGSAGAGGEVIPPNATLDFEVELLDVN